MSNAAPTSPDILSGIQRLNLADLDRRLADLDAERAALSLLRRSLAARDRAKRRASGHSAAGADNGE
jgi:hypothetical protein